MTKAIITELRRIAQKSKEAGDWHMRQEQESLLSIADELEDAKDTKEAITTMNPDPVYRVRTPAFPNGEMCRLVQISNDDDSVEVQFDDFGTAKVRRQDILPQVTPEEADRFYKTLRSRPSTNAAPPPPPIFESHRGVRIRKC